MVACGTVTQAGADPGPRPLGIDVSHHNGAIDWKAVAHSGVVFAYVKATEGATFADHLFGANWARIKEAGMVRGAYHFFRPAAPALAQADRFLAAMGELSAGDLPPMLDLEEAGGADRDEWAGLPVEERVAAALAWLDRVERACGRKPVVYTRRGFLEAKLGSVGALAGYPLWVAHYTRAKRPSVPKGWTRWTFWQYSECGAVAGISGNVDMDWYDGTAEQLVKLAGCE
jgi:lysozyme